MVGGLLQQTVDEHFHRIADEWRERKRDLRANHRLRIHVDHGGRPVQLQERLVDLHVHRRGAGSVETRCAGHG